MTMKFMFNNSVHTIHPVRRTAISVLGLSMALVVGCDSDSGDGDGNLAVDETGPRFAIGTSVISPQTFEPIAYVGFAESLDGGEVSLSDALEVPGGAQVWGVPGSGIIFVTQHETATISKFAFVDGELTELGRVGLLGAGVSRLEEEQLVFDGPDHGYLFDLISGQIIELDLDAMETQSTTDIRDVLDAELPTFIYTFQERADGRLTTVTYATDFEQELVSDTSWILVFDPETGNLERYAAPCGGLMYTAESASGDWIYMSGPWVAGVDLIYSSRAPEPCIVRLPVGSDQPEAQTPVLAELTGEPTGGLVPIGDGQVYVRGLDTESYPITDTTTAAELYVAVSAWRTWRVDLDNPTSATLLDVPPRIGGITFLFDGEAYYENNTATDLSSSTLVRTTADGDAADGLLVPGLPTSLVQMYTP